MKKNFTNKKFYLFFVFTLCLSSCAQQYTAQSFGDPYGFFSGIWHGMIFPFSLIGSFIFDDIFIIGKPNTGFTYFLGFVLGFLGIGVPRIW
jgi:hypothetical protein